MKSAFGFFALAFLTCTWDTIATIELRGFTVKIYQIFILLSALLTFWANRQRGIVDYVRPLSSPFASTMLVLAGFYLGLSPWSGFPLKSFFYSCWLIFDILALWLTVQHLAEKFPRAYFVRVAWATLLSLSLVILIDQIAYQYGYTAGFLGDNQDRILKWGMSRPHAFSFEPSYIAAFLSTGAVTLCTLILPSLRRAWLGVLGMLLVLFATFAPSSRTGWFNLALGIGALCVLPLLAGRKLKIKVVGGLAGFFALAIVIFYISTPAPQLEVMNRALINSLFVGQDGSGNARINAHIQAYHLAKETNWIGTGFAASFKYFIDHGGMDLSVDLPNAGSFEERHVGSEIIMSTWGQLLAEGGIVALSLFALAGYFLVRALFRKWKTDPSNELLGSVAASAVFFVFVAFWLGNINRGDVWVWYALWSAFASGKFPSAA